ncbi:MAG: alkaline phosphatase D family protein [Deltaproteobacteria bacterium]|nr:alkaline phosphatase D family protein [Deltaproteobacteria bacterium]
MIPPVSRRGLLGAVGLAGAELTLGCSSDEGSGEDGSDLPSYEYTGPPGPADLFQHGVASGDPFPDRVILWTRVTPGADRAVRVYWEVARDPALEDRVGAGWFETDGERDHTVKVDAAGLEPGTTYYFRFRAEDRESPIGRTRTAPEGAVDRLRFGVCSCSNYAYGYFAAYRHLAGRHDLDAVLHLGDYIYEYGTGEYGTTRECEPPHEIVSLADYRMRYSQYRRDPDLQEAHRQLPWIVVWDDHEITNDSHRTSAQNHQPEEGDYEARKAAAYQAYAEWMPFREIAPGKIWREFRFGDLVDLVMLDTRIWGRDPQLPLTELEAARAADRTLLGEDQEAWLGERLRSAGATWKLLGQQVMMGEFWVGTGPVNMDQWDGYEASRARFLGLLRDAAIDNVVVLTGDIHSTWALDLPADRTAYDPDTGAGSLAVEMICTSITSPGVDDAGGALSGAVLASNPHVHAVDFDRRGYLVLDVTAERAQGAWFYVDDVTDPRAAESFGVAYSVAAGSAHLAQDDDAVSPPAKSPAAAP